MGESDVAARAIVQDTRVRRLGAARTSLIALFVALGLLLVVAAAWLLLRSRNQGFVLASYELSTVRRAPIASTAELAGVVGFSVSRALQTPAASEVASVSARPGDEVRAGDVLLVLRSDELDRRIAADERLLRSARRERELLVLDRRPAAVQESLEVELSASRAERAASAYAAARELHAGGIASRAELQAAESAKIEAAAALERARVRARIGEPAHLLALAAADDRIEEAEARLASDRKLAGDLTVRSPFDGTVLDVAARAGQSLQAREPVATVVDRSSVVVRFEVPERQAAHVVPGKAIGIRTGGRSAAGLVVAADARAKGASETMTATVTMTAVFASDPPAGLRAGSSVAVEVTLEYKAGALLLPRGPYLSGGNESWVYVIRGDTAVRTPIALGLRNAAQVEVARGLSEGDRVIVSSYEDLMAREVVSLDPRGGRER